MPGETLPGAGLRELHAEGHEGEATRLFGECTGAAPKHVHCCHGHMEDADEEAERMVHQRDLAQHGQGDPPAPVLREAARVSPTVKVLMFCVRTMKTCMSGPRPGKGEAMSGMRSCRVVKHRGKAQGAGLVGGYCATSR